jgi:hypothetical protein
MKTNNLYILGMLVLVVGFLLPFFSDAKTPKTRSVLADVHRANLQAPIPAAGTSTYGGDVYQQIRNRKDRTAATSTVVTDIASVSTTTATALSATSTATTTVIAASTTTAVAGTAGQSTPGTIVAQQIRSYKNLTSDLINRFFPSSNYAPVGFSRPVTIGLSIFSLLSIVAGGILLSGYFGISFASIKKNIVSLIAS